MWRTAGLLLVAVFAVTTAENEDPSTLTQRLKRSPHYECPPYYYPPPPPPPPPPFWPPPPPPPYWRHNHARYGPPRYDIAEAQSQAQAQSNEKAESSANAQSQSNFGGQPTERLIFKDQDGKEPCDSCHSQGSAVSNAQSETGAAVAIAIARAKTN